MPFRVIICKLYMFLPQGREENNYKEDGWIYMIQTRIQLYIESEVNTNE